MTRESILICTYSVGYGHHKVSEAIKEALVAANPALQVHIADPLKLGRPHLNLFLTNFYLELLKRVPFVYKALYSKAERVDSQKRLSGGYSLLWRLLINKGCLDRISSLVEDIKPAVVICAHPFTAVAMSRWREKQGTLQPVLAGVVTDFTFHPFWAGTDLDGYFVAARDIVSDAVLKGIPRERVWAVGIPVSKGFAQPCDKAAVRTRLGLSPVRKTLLVMGGGLGLGDIEEVVQTLGSSCQPIQMMVVTGFNKVLQKRLLETVKGLVVPVKVFSFVDNVAELMGASDAVITKPGGVTVAEAMASRVPIIIWRPIPGQEERNAAFLVSRGLAMRAGDAAELAQAVARLGQDKSKSPVEMAVLQRLASKNLAGMVSVLNSYNHGRCETEL